MNYDVLFGLLGTGLGVGLTLIYQARNAAVKALNEANAAVESVSKSLDVVKTWHDTTQRQTKAQLDVYQADLDKRIQRLEVRLDDLNGRVAALQIKR